MSVYKKLMEARIRLQNTELKKTGHNKFAGYTYFELGDFLPTVQTIFNEIGLCGVISFGEELATLTIHDVETNDCIKVTSPMKEANLKGCHPIQNLGAVETYTRRYLWVAALEIVEHDILDATTGSEKPASEQKQSSAPKLQPPIFSVSQSITLMQSAKDLATLQDIFGKAYKQANDTQKITLKEKYDAFKSFIEGESDLKSIEGAK